MGGMSHRCAENSQHKVSRAQAEPNTQTDKVNWTGENCEKMREKKEVLHILTQAQNIQYKLFSVPLCMNVHHNAHSSDASVHNFSIAVCKVRLPICSEGAD